MDNLPLPQDNPPGSKEPWVLKELSVMHKQVCSLLAQGLGRVEIAAICEITPEYVTMLARQPLCKEYIAEMNEYVGTRMEALFEESVNVMADAMKHGTLDERLKGARLQLEATKRLGKANSLEVNINQEDNRLVNLAERLTTLLQEKKGAIIDGTAFQVPNESTQDA